MGSFVSILESTSKYLNSIKSNIEIEFDSSNQAKIVHDAVLLEFEGSPDFRSKMSIVQDDNILVLKICAEDATSFRASLNSAIKCMNLSLEINELTD